MDNREEPVVCFSPEKQKLLSKIEKKNWVYLKKKNQFNYKAEIMISNNSSLKKFQPCFERIKKKNGKDMLVFNISVTKQIFLLLFISKARFPA